MAEQFSNKATTTLNGAIDNSQTSITVTSATGFPTSGDFRIVVPAEGANTDEIMTVTAVSGTTWTVTRASEEIAGVQTASAHSSGATVSHVLTAGGLIARMPSLINVELVTLASLATKTWADADVSRQGGMLAGCANDGVGMLTFYRDGSFNTVIGIQSGSFVFRGTTFSAGSNNTGYHFYISANTAGATLNLKNTNSFSRTFYIYHWGGSVGDDYGRLI